jgi:hypothetical protein
MPRQIIDTESSRPRYVRRIALTWAAALVLIGVLIFVLFAAYGHYAHAPVPGK